MNHSVARLRVLQRIRESRRPSIPTSLLTQNPSRQHSPSSAQPFSGSNALSNPLCWYNCGPTVYSDSHMGHARNYVTIDILRRILEDYFRLNVHFVQNITDIDDKLIQAVSNWKTSSTPHLNSQYQFSSGGRTDAAILRDIALHYEEAFWKDMQDLNVRRPDYVLRVTEHLEEIQEMVQKLLKNGSAYIGRETGSIYFDTQFYASQGMNYDHFGCCSSDEWTSGEVVASSEKKSPRDFVLWKRDDSAFGFDFKGQVRGRPGWHIECSAMSASVFGPHVDIHSGGIDLQFPHHTNEVAQSCAYYEQNNWVDDWIHVGHLHIHGLKMSKSLKNFTSIQEGLKSYDSRAIRMMSLQHHFADSVDFSDNLMQQSIDTERFFKEFFLKMEAIVRNVSQLQKKPTSTSIALRKELWKTQALVEDALLQDFNTPKALNALADLVRQTNRYEQNCTPGTIDHTILSSVAQYVTDMFRVFGFTEEKIGYSKSLSDTRTTSLMDSFTQFRSNIRQLARGNDMNSILVACDNVRDKVLPDMGIRLEDRSNGSSIWKFEDPEIIKRQMEREEEEKYLRNKHAEEKRLKEEQKLTIAQIPPSSYFKSLHASEFSEYDSDGFPTKDANGEPLSKSQTKRLKKILQRHAELHQKHLDQL